MSSDAPASVVDSALIFPGSNAWGDNTFLLPRKHISLPADMPKLTTSAWFARFSAFVLGVQAALRGVSRSTPHTVSPAAQVLVDKLNEAASWIAEIPPVKQAQRFGNVAFRLWHARFVAAAPGWVAEAITLCGRFPDGFASAAPEGSEAAVAAAVAAAAAESSAASALAGPVTRAPWATAVPAAAAAAAAPAVAVAVAPSTAYPVAALQRRTADIPCSVADELAGFLTESFGNAGRIDYGTGHEMTFVAFLAALTALGVFTQEDFAALGCDVFGAYLSLMRQLQRVYWLEPAGSKGAWGLDDYQFLPFLWGAAQLQGSRYGTPAAATADAAGSKAGAAAPAAAAAATTVNASTGEHAVPPAEGEYLLLDAARFVCTVKTGPLAVHSPYIASLFDVPSWEILSAGLNKMYGNEVLCKFPVMQHTLFASTMAATPLAGVDTRRLAAAFDLPGHMFAHE
jgi:hypothetical protein